MTVRPTAEDDRISAELCRAGWDAQRRFMSTYGAQCRIARRQDPQYAEALLMMVDEAGERETLELGEQIHQRVATIDVYDPTPEYETLTRIENAAWIAAWGATHQEELREMAWRDPHDWGVGAKPDWPWHKTR